MQNKRTILNTLSIIAIGIIGIVILDFTIEAPLEGWNNPK